MTGVSAVVPNWNQRDLLAGLLRNLGRQTCPPDEILVVDNGSDDDSVGEAERLGARVIEMGGNTGFSRAELLAIRAGGMGDVTDTHVEWRTERSIGSKPSPLLVDGLLYNAHDAGAGNCLDAKTGEVVWEARLGGNYTASPLYADGRIYFFNEEGATTVLKPGRTHEVLAVNELDDGFMASPAISGQALYLRTKTHLYRIEQ